VEESEEGTLATLIILLLVIWSAFGAAGGWISVQRGRSWLSGFLLGFFLSGIGLVIAALLPRPIELQVREAVAVEQGVAIYKQTGQFPSGPRAMYPMGIGGTSNALEASATSLVQKPPGKLRQDLGWKELFAEAANLPSERRDEIETAGGEIFSRFPELRAWSFAMSDRAMPALLLLFDDKVMQILVKSNESPSVQYFYADAKVQFFTRENAQDRAVEVGVARQSAAMSTVDSWLLDVGPPKALDGVLGVAEASDWITVVTERSLAPPHCEAAETSTVIGQAPSDVIDDEPEVILRAVATPAELSAARRDLQLLKSLRSDGLIAEEEYVRRSATILDRITES